MPCNWALAIPLLPEWKVGGNNLIWSTQKGPSCPGISPGCHEVKKQDAKGRTYQSLHQERHHTPKCLLIIIKPSHAKTHSSTSPTQRTLILASLTTSPSALFTSSEIYIPSLAHAKQEIFLASVCALPWLPSSSAAKWVGPWPDTAAPGTLPCPPLLNLSSCSYFLGKSQCKQQWGTQHKLSQSLQRILSLYSVSKRVFRQAQSSKNSKQFFQQAIVNSTPADSTCCILFEGAVLTWQFEHGNLASKACLREHSCPHNHLSLSGKNKGLRHNNKDQEVLNKGLSWMGDKQLPPRKAVWVTLVLQILQYKLN